MCSNESDVQPGKKVFGEDNTGYETSLEKEGMMDFAEVEIAEQLTYIDSVRNNITTHWNLLRFHCQTLTGRLMVVFPWGFRSFLLRWSRTSV